MKRWLGPLSVCFGLCASGCAAGPAWEPGVDEKEIHEELAELGTSADSCGTTVLFDEDFSDAAAGWTLGTGWEIGPTQVSTCQHPSTPSDPAFDHTPTDDNGVAGVYLGGCPPIAASTFPYHYLTSPILDTDVDGAVTLSFWRWLNTLSRNHVKIEVFDGTSWVVIYQSTLGAGSRVLDSSWTNVTYDLTPYRNPNLQIRFGWRVFVHFGGAYSSGWNIDDVQVTTDACL
ncbi:MAG TPA: hypothetical protein VL242_15775 [Sorangium sp.]|nr:hypothetical protein [Sorangium sp.]